MTDYNFWPVEPSKKIPFTPYSRGQRISTLQIWAYDESVWSVFKRDSICNFQSFTGGQNCRLIRSPVRDVIYLCPWLVGSNGLFPCNLLWKYYKCVSFQALTNPSAHCTRAIPFVKIVILSMFHVLLIQVAYFRRSPNLPHDSSWVKIIESYCPHENLPLPQFPESQLPICLVFQAKTKCNF